MKILKNPIKGAEISDLWIYDVFYLSKEKGETFKVGTVMQFEDRVADHLKYLYGFLEELTRDEAKEYIAYMNKPLVCPDCQARFTEKIALSGHQRSHGDKVTVEGAMDGIPIATGAKPDSEVVAKSPQQIIEEQARAEGLEGEGLVIERPTRRTI